MSDDPTPSQDAEETVKPLGKSYAPSRTSLVIFGILLFAVVFCGFMWHKSATAITQMTTSKNYETGFSPDGDLYIRRWKSSGNKATVLFDLNRDNNYEKASVYNYQENLIYESFDDNEDGYDEWGIRYTPSGKKAAEFYDMDEDGCHERIINFNDEQRIEYKDVDFDCEYDSVFVYKGNRLINSFSAEELDLFYFQPKGSTSADSSSQK